MEAHIPIALARYHGVKWSCYPFTVITVLDGGDAHFSSRIFTALRCQLHNLYSSTAEMVRTTLFYPGSPTLDMVGSCIILGAFLVFDHLIILLDLVRLCHDHLFRQLRFRRLNWNRLNKGSRENRTKSSIKGIKNQKYPLL